ncbi:MAG: hypothetical protein P9L99_06760 [Candidatus Lernaella stagnicola]|nr:hypothetical protein [Candidatus Lernaella stagnicola]
MDQTRPFPSPRSAWLIAMFLAVMAHAAVFFGGIVRPESLARLAEAERTVGWDTFDFWATMILPFGGAIAPFAVTMLWGLAGFALAYLALARLVGHFAALGAAGAVFIGGYPGWSAVLPTAWMLWLPPAALAVLVLSFFLRGRLVTWRARIATWSARRAVKAAWVGVLVFAFFVVAEQARLGFRGSINGAFPYEKKGLAHGFDKDLDMTRRLQHAGLFMLAARRMEDNSLRHDSSTVRLAAHGAAARFVCRIGAARPNVTPPLRTPKIVPAGWVLRQGVFGIEPAFNTGGIRYNEWSGKVDSRPAANWYELRADVLSGDAKQVEVAGPLHKRASAKDLFIEIETHDAGKVEASATYDGEPWKLVRRTLAAGDRTIVRFAAHVPCPLANPDATLNVRASAPRGMLDFDVLLRSVETPDSDEIERKELKPFTFDAL